MPARHLAVPSAGSSAYAASQAVEVMGATLARRSRFGISCWDAAILEARRALGCSVVLSEDLDPGTDDDGLRVKDPFS